MKKRVVIAGFGDTGLIVAINLYKDFEIIGISPKPCLVSGQELGTRLAQPEIWKQNYLMPFGRYKKLEGIQTLHGLITHIDTAKNTVEVHLKDGSQQQVKYDALVISSGVSNGFWRNNKLESLDVINSNIDNEANQLSKAKTIAIIGGGATGVSSASNLKEQYPEKNIHFFYSQAQALPGYHPKTRDTIETQLNKQGIELHPSHRAILSEGFNSNTFTTTATEWQTGQKPFQADLTLWTVGKLTPNSRFVPPDMLDEDGFVKADKHLRVPGYHNVFTVGDITNSDPHRSSARNAGFLTVAHNIRTTLEGKNKKLKIYKASLYRWGSILGVQNNGMRVFTPKGGSVLVNKKLVTTVLFPFFVRQMIYKGIKRE